MTLQHHIKAIHIVMLYAFQGRGRVMYRVRPSELAVFKIETDGTLRLLQETTCDTHTKPW